LQAGNAVAWTWCVPSFVSSQQCLCQLLFAGVTAALHALKGLPLCNTQGGSCLLLSYLCSSSCWKACLPVVNELLLYAAVTTLQHMLEGLSTSRCCHKCAENNEASVSVQSSSQLLLHLLSLKQGHTFAQTDANHDACVVPVFMQSIDAVVLCQSDIYDT